MISGNRRFTLIGERINPTGRRIFQEQLRAGDLSAIERDVKAQVEGGADVLDVNMGVPMVDEAELLTQAVTMIQELTDLPLCIDSSVVEALDAGLAAYDGRALVNSVTAEDERLEQVLPLVQELTEHVRRAAALQQEKEGLAERLLPGIRAGAVEAFQTTLQKELEKLFVALLPKVDRMFQDLASRAQKTVIWRGTAQAEIDRRRDDADRAERVRNAVRDMLEKYPRLK